MAGGVGGVRAGDADGMGDLGPPEGEAVVQRCWGRGSELVLPVRKYRQRQYHCHHASISGNLFAWTKRGHTEW